MPRRNIAHESLALFDDGETIGDFTANRGLGVWRKRYTTTWTRDPTCLGWVFFASARSVDQDASATLNLTEGKIRFRPGSTSLNGDVWVFRKEVNEWWKVHWRSTPGQPDSDKIVYSCTRGPASATRMAPLMRALCNAPGADRWVRVLDHNGNKTDKWDQYLVPRVQDPLHRGCCLPLKLRVQNMMLINKKQHVIFRPDSAVPVRPEAQVMART